MSYSDILRSEIEGRISTLNKRERMIFQAGKGFGMTVAFQAVTVMSEESSAREAARVVLDLAKLEVSE